MSSEREFLCWPWLQTDPDWCHRQSLFHAEFFYFFFPGWILYHKSHESYFDSKCLLTKRKWPPPSWVFNSPYHRLTEVSGGVFYASCLYLLWMMGLSHYIRNCAAFVANEIRRWLLAQTGVKFKSVCYRNQYLHMVCLREKPVLARFSSPHKCLTFFILFYFYIFELIFEREGKEISQASHVKENA